MLLLRIAEEIVLRCPVPDRFFFSRQSSEQTKSVIRLRGGDGSQESISLGFNVVDKVGDRILIPGHDRESGE